MDSPNMVAPFKYHAFIQEVDVLCNYTLSTTRSAGRAIVAHHLAG